LPHTIQRHMICQQRALTRLIWLCIYGDLCSSVWVLLIIMQTVLKENKPDKSPSKILVYKGGHPILEYHYCYIAHLYHLVNV